MMNVSRKNKDETNNDKNGWMNIIPLTMDLNRRGREKKKKKSKKGMENIRRGKEIR
jgi:hypothetical protein